MFCYLCDVTRVRYSCFVYKYVYLCIVICVMSLVYDIHVLCKSMCTYVLLFVLCHSCTILSVFYKYVYAMENGP